MVTFLRSRNAVVKCWSPWAIFYSCSISATELIGLMKMELVRYWRWPVMDWTESTKVNWEREISGPLKLFPMVVTWARRLLRVNLLCIYIYYGNVRRKTLIKAGCSPLDQSDVDQYCTCFISQMKASLTWSLFFYFSLLYRTYHSHMLEMHYFMV